MDITLYIYIYKSPKRGGAFHKAAEAQSHKVGGGQGSINKTRGAAKAPGSSNGGVALRRCCGGIAARDF